jgi:hypothetical protein
MQIQLYDPARGVMRENTARPIWVANGYSLYV